MSHLPWWRVNCIHVLLVHCIPFPPLLIIHNPIQFPEIVKLDAATGQDALFHQMYTMYQECMYTVDSIPGRVPHKVSLDVLFMLKSTHLGTHPMMDEVVKLLWTFRLQRTQTIRTHKFHKQSHLNRMTSVLSLSNSVSSVQRQAVEQSLILSIAEHEDISLSLAPDRERQRRISLLSSSSSTSMISLSFFAARSKKHSLSPSAAQVTSYRERTDCNLHCQTVGRP